MKNALILSLVLLAVEAQAQTAIKVHDNGQISLQSGSVLWDTDSYIGSDLLRAQHHLKLWQNS